MTLTFILGSEVYVYVCYVGKLHPLSSLSPPPSRPQCLLFPCGFLSNIFYSVYFKNTVCNTYNMQNVLIHYMLLVRLLVNSRLLESEKLYTDFQLCAGWAPQALRCSKINCYFLQKHAYLQSVSSLQGVESIGRLLSKLALGNRKHILGPSY